ncbi:MAG: hypothetical protein NUW01_10535, partial [Gemmatimonadaceae bacterium]|nr:hypothetical protein [Gemmatimonadaceae bacterium]
MLKYTRLFGALSLIFVVAACGDDSRDDTLATDTTLNRDLELANVDTGVQPALTDVPSATEPAPVAPAPRTTTTQPRTTTRTTPRPTTTSTAPRTTPSGNTATTGTGTAEREMGTIAAGSTVSLSSSTRVCTNTHKVGDRFTATVRQSVTGSNGAVIPAGATATVEITSLRRSDNVNDPIVVGVAIRSISFGGRTYAVSGTTSSAQVDRVRSSTTRDDGKKVATGAAIGAIAGQILGRDTRGTVTGAAAGAAVGAGAAVATANYEGCIPTGGAITVSLNNSVQVCTCTE